MSKSAHSSPRDGNTSQIHGIGLWHSWTRNFSSPLLAIWDLLDNAFDATSSTAGKIHIDPDRDCPDRLKRGIVLMNSCERPVKPLTSILKAYNSSKGNATDYIGENGVGIKQGCATLSDISFVLARNEDHFSIGVLAYELQKPSGIYLPAFSFSCALDNPRQMHSELQNICVVHPDVCGVVEQYGGGDRNQGINQLVNHYQRMSSLNPGSYARWGGCDYVFCLVIHNLKHGKQSTDAEDNGFSLRKVNENGRRVDDLLKQIAEELPKHYLHVSHTLNVEVNRHVIAFSYWQRRLVELTHFKVIVNMKYPLSREDPEDLKQYLLNSEEQHVLKIYLGFDALRCSDDQQSKYAKMVWHSRKSGRLIKTHSDARGELRLTTGGTNFCQGLTIIVDDIEGMLPLNPTKSDFAFGERSNGSTHHENLIDWIGAVTKVYYNHHLRESNERKRDLSDRVKSLHEEALHYATDDIEAQAQFKSIADCEFTRFRGADFGFFQRKVRVKNARAVKVVQGPDTIMRLPPPPAPPEPAKEEIGPDGKVIEKRKRGAADPNDSDTKMPSTKAARDENYDLKRRLQHALQMNQQKDTLIAQLQGEKETLQDEKEALKAEKDAVDQKNTLYADKYDRLKQKDRDRKEQCKELKQENARLKSQIDELTRAYNGGTLADIPVPAIKDEMIDESPLAANQSSRSLQDSTATGVFGFPTEEV